MNILDWVIVVWLVIAFLLGARLGLIYRIGHIIGLVVGIWLAFTYGMTVASWLGDSWGIRIAVVLFLIAGVAELGGLVATLLDKAFKIVSWLPFLKLANGIIGGIVSLLTHLVLLGIVLSFALTLPVDEQWLLAIEQSTLGPWLVIVGTTVTNFIPWFNA
ncbi:MAG: CvpA family protein [Candidatus Kerfeldbacteria bacterium]|nr:CvpA family protein [Candidatus Kerfeldbacteria bacterium]